MKACPAVCIVIVNSFGEGKCKQTVWSGGVRCFLLTDYRRTDIIKAVMYMTIQQILREKNLSRYQLSKKSGVPWATLADICSGKTTLSRCSAGTLMKLSSTLDIPMEQLITLTVEKPQMHGASRLTELIWKRICPPVWIKRSVSTFRAKKTKCLIWTACGENYIVRSTPISGATPLHRSRQIIFAQNIYKGVRTRD